MWKSESKSRISSGAIGYRGIGILDMSCGGKNVTRRVIK